MRKAAIATALILIITEVKINGQWSTNPNENLEVNPWGVFVTACSDGEGGAYIGWKNFDYYYTRAYLQYVDKYGYVQWDEPLMILDKGDLQYEPFLIEDGEGNCIVTVAVSNIIEILPGGTKLLDYTNYIQKINKNGTLLWDTNAVRLTLNDRDQYTPSIVTDQKGGALFCWYEAIINEEENSFARYYTQHIQSNGIRTWSDTGKVIMDSLTQPLIPMAVSDGAGGMIVYYGDDFQQVNNTYFERIDFFGNSLWKRASPTYKYKNMTSLGDKGAVFTGRSEYHSTTQKEDLYINIIDNNGNFLFEEEGLIYADSIEVFNQSNIIYNESNKLIYFSWARGVVHTYGLIDYQIMRLSGDLLFSNEANPVTVVQSSKGAPQIVGSEDNIIVMWRDSRDSTIDYSEIYSQKVDMLGNQLWDENDVAVSLAESNAWTLITDENSGAILVRSRDPHWGVYAQQINSDGELGIVTKVENEEENLADKIELLQNYPNPFNPTTKIKYTLTSQMERASGNNSGLRVRVLLKVYNILGKEVQTLVNGMQGRGTYEVEFNGRVLPSGVYLITLQAGSYRHTIKSLLIK